MFDIISDLFGGGDQGFDLARGVNERNRQLLDKIKLPEYENFNPELYSSETADYQLTGEDPLIRAAQLDSLAKLAGLAETGLSDVDAAGFDRARDEGNQIARGATQAAIQNAASRGVGGSGLEFALREAGNQAGAERAQNAGLETAATAARQRALYNQAYGDGLSRQRGDDFRANSANTGIINQFNRENTAIRNNTSNANTDSRNSAFKYNQGLQDKRFGNEMARATGQMDLNNREGDIGLAEEEQKRRRRGAITGAGGALVGAAFGGPMGAQIGYGVGSGLGG